MTENALPVNYYLGYFMQMVQIVENRYSDLFTEEDRAFVAAIHSASEPSIRLLVRLFMRKGPNFLVNKLKYDEVPSINEALEELKELKLIEENPDVYGFELVELLPIAQSRPNFSADPKCKKAELVEAWLEDDEIRNCEDWGVEDPIVTPCHYESYRRIQVLFFGNERQSLTEFILEDLGLFKYEKYPLDKSNRLFNAPNDLDMLIQLNDLRTDFYLMSETKTWDDLVEFSHSVQSLTIPSNLQNRWFHLLNRIAYRLEQRGELGRALELFELNDLPPARERRVRILFKQEKFRSAEVLLEAIGKKPYSADESQFHRRFINKLRTKLRKAKLDLAVPPINEIERSWPKGEGTVEQQACEHFENAVWLENSLPMAVFGLIHWAIVFSDIPGVWHHPFQDGPTDLTSGSFSEKRADLIASLHNLSKAKWRETLIQTWKEKTGIRNPFVQWNTLTIETVIACFDALTRDQWLGIFTHLLSDLRQYRSGFPDLFQVNDQSYRFIEIKGPGDKLQDNQIAWLNKFHELGINADVCHVRYT